MSKYEYKGTLINAGMNAKTIKGDDEYLTAIMYLLPWKQGGANLCAMAEQAACIDACLVSAGRGAMNSVQKSRARKTAFFNADRTAFMAELVADTQRFVAFCAKRDVKPVIRLNGTSDIRWELIKATRDGVQYASIMAAFPEVQFYDYTKIANRRVDGLPNYHLTFSYSAANPTYAKHVQTALERGMNVAAVFRTKDVQPKRFLGRDVVNGDADDMRFLDPQGVVVALYAKGKAKHDTTGFVVD